MGNEDKNNKQYFPSRCVDKPKVCLWCTSSINSADFIEKYHDEFDIISVAIDAQENKFRYDYTHIIRIPKFIRMKVFKYIYSIFTLPKIIYLMKKYDRIVGCHVVHYLSELFAISILVANPKKPIVYFTYGSDYRYPLLRSVVKNIINTKITTIFSGSPIVKKELRRLYDTESPKIDTTLTIGVDKGIFRKYSLIEKIFVKKKYKLLDNIVLFYPRKISIFYNHHIVLKAINLLEENLRKKVKLILIEYGDIDYINYINNTIKKLDLECNIIIFKKRLSKKEMAEVYNIADITLSVPANDGIGRSNIEAVLCGSILLLNANVNNYRVVFRDGKYCKYTNLTPSSIAKSIESIIANLESLKDEKERIRISKFVDWEKNKKLIANRIKSIINENIGEGG